MRDGDGAAAVGDQDNGSVDRLHSTFQLEHAAGQGEVVATQRFDAAHARQFGGQQRLPVIGDVIAQAGHDHNGGLPVIAHRTNFP